MVEPDPKTAFSHF